MGMAMTENARLLLLLIGMAVCLFALWPRPPLDVTLSRGAVSNLEFSYTRAVNQIGGLYWRDGVIHYTDRAKEITREQLRARLNTEQWTQVEAAERKGRPLTADEMSRRSAAPQ